MTGHRPKRPRDPVLEVPCPHCRAGVGKRCTRPSEHPVFGGGVHAGRVRGAIVAGYLSKAQFSGV